MEIIVGDKEYPILDLTIEQYELLKSVDNIEDIQLIAIMTGAPIETLKKAKITDLAFAAKFLRSEMAFQEDIGTLDLVVDFHGKKYGLIKPLEMSYDEFVNLEIFMAQEPLDLLKISTHLYKPLKTDDIGENRKLIDYDLQECMDRMETFKKFPIKKVMSALFFLINLGQTLMEDLIGSTETKLKATEFVMKTNLPVKKLSNQ
jgi:hypothetical protein